MGLFTEIEEYEREKNFIFWLLFVSCLLDIQEMSSKRLNICPTFPEGSGLEQAF